MPELDWDLLRAWVRAEVDICMAIMDVDPDGYRHSGREEERTADKLFAQLKGEKSDDETKAKAS